MVSSMIAHTLNMSSLLDSFVEPYHFPPPITYLWLKETKRNIFTLIRLDQVLSSFDCFLVWLLYKILGQNVFSSDEI